MIDFLNYSPQQQRQALLIVSRKRGLPEPIIEMAPVTTHTPSPEPSVCPTQHCTKAQCLIYFLSFNWK